MTATVLVTALPVTLVDHESINLTAFITHKLVPEGDDPDGHTLAEFPAVAEWVDTLSVGTFSLRTSNSAEPLPLRVVSRPDPAAWSACVPPGTPVVGYPNPVYSTSTWQTLPASKLSDHAVDLHLAAVHAAPGTRPAVMGNAVADNILRRVLEIAPSSGLRAMMGDDDRIHRRDAATLSHRNGDAASTLGLSERDRVARDTAARDYFAEPSPVERLFDQAATTDSAMTDHLDEMLARGASPEDPTLAMMLDAHAARRYYDRPAEPHPDPQPHPDPGSTPTPRPTLPERDFHGIVAGFGGTPALLRVLGLAVDLALDVDDPAAALAGAQWVAVELTVPEETELTVLPARRTSVTVNGSLFRARSTGEWVDGALPLGDDTWRILDLDPDASGLKLDQHFHSMHRSLASELNGDRTTSAPATLRSSGFGIARVARSEQLCARVAAAEQQHTAGLTDELLYDDLVRGIRVEVWDDISRQWHSLHQRLVTVRGVDGRTVLHDVPDTGFLQLSALNRNPDNADGPMYVHEVIAGWEGWSLSAPRPGKTIVHVQSPSGGSTEAVVDDPATANNDDRPDGISVRTRVAPGTLPRLRYGTAYSFRILGVDLAGNSVPQRFVSVTMEDTRAHLQAVTESMNVRDAGGLATQVLHSLVDAAPRSRGKRELSAALRTGETSIDEALAASLAAAQGLIDSRGARISDPAVQIHAATAVIAAAGGTARHRPNLAVAPEVLADLARSAGAPVRTVTTPRPYLRWDPVPFPVIVAYDELGTGEQLSSVVIRTGVETEGVDGRRRSQRHIAPPKCSQLEAETAGLFDAAIGTGDDTQIATKYAIALIESGTLLDKDAPDPDNPLGGVPQTGIALKSRPGANPDTAVTLDQIAANRGTPLGEGQYVVHTTGTLRLPYLPDPYADGVTLTFFQAGAPHRLPDARVLQTVTAPYRGAWPRRQPFRLVLEASEAGASMHASVKGHVITVALPPGESVGVRMSSSIRREDLSVFGLWRSHPVTRFAPDAGGDVTDEQAAAYATMESAAANGVTWWLTPTTDLSLVHAVPAPVRAPQLSFLRIATRPPGLGVLALTGVIETHGPSTERFILRANWSDVIDDPATPHPVELAQHATVTDSPVGPWEEAGVLGVIDLQGPLAGVDLSEGSVGMHRAVQTFSDTKHRVVTYMPSGTTRYRELFPAKDIPPDDDPSLAGRPVVLDVPSSARPGGVNIVDTVPVLQWESIVEPADPFARRSTRRSGIRVWLARPWFTSGAGELVGVVTAPNQSAAVVGDAFTSLWGSDPILIDGGAVSAPRSATEPPLRPVLEIVNHNLGEAALDVPRPAHPVAMDDVTLVDVDGSPSVRVYGYRPTFDDTTGRWWVDIALDDGPISMPFIRLAIARYQPNSLSNMELSTVALAGWVQPLPTRVLTVSRRSPNRVQVTLTGTVGLLRHLPWKSHVSQVGKSRHVRASVQYLPDGGSDLEWQTVDAQTVPAVALDTETWKVTWSGELGIVVPVTDDAPKRPAMQTPGESTTWRVLVEEFEILDCDDAQGNPGSATVERLVYADTVAM